MPLNTPMPVDADWNDYLEHVSIKHLHGTSHSFNQLITDAAADDDDNDA